VPAEVETTGESDLVIPQVVYRVDENLEPAVIERAGIVEGELPPGTHLWLVTRTLGSTYDSTPERNPGTERIFPIGEIGAGGGPCWETRSDIGYAEALGLTFQDLIVTVDDATSSLLANPDPGTAADGFDPKALQSFDATTVATYDIVTE
jgi:hypothetical protein